MDDTNFTPNTEKDDKAREYIEKVNHAPYPTIALVLCGGLIVLSGFFLLGSF
jgi:hypothetical protein